MHILGLSRIDCAAAGYFLSKAVNRYTPHESRMVRLRGRNVYQFPTDIVEPSEEQLRAVWEWADIVHVHDFAWPWMPLGCGPSDKPTVVTYHGTAYRKNYRKHDKACRDLGWLRTVSTIDLAMISGAQWMPDTRIDMSKFLPRARGPFMVIHAPTNRHVKGTTRVVKAIKSLRSKGISLDLIEDTPYYECLGRKGQGHVLIDQFELGYGCNAIEAWALGLVVVADAKPNILAAMEKEIGRIPFVRSPLDDLAKIVLRLKEDVDFYNEARERGWQHWQNFHAPDVVAARAIGYYEEALRRRRPKRRRTVKRGTILIRYIGRHSGLQTFWGPRTGKRYEFGGSKRDGVVDMRDVATGDSRNPGFLEMTEGGRGRIFRKVR
jgi:hypothetical protein